MNPTQKTIPSEPLSVRKTMASPLLKNIHFFTSIALYCGIATAYETRESSPGAPEPEVLAGNDELVLCNTDELNKGNDLATPEMMTEEPAAGLRVRQVAIEYEGTKVYHALYLPTDWKPARKFPVMVEYTGNKFAKSGSSGEVKDANLGYGLTGGQGFIWVSMPYIEKGGKENAVWWWGDRQATIDYCKTNVLRICKQFGGDTENVFICGFSRGAIATSYIGLADDEIAALWKGVFTHDHFDGATPWDYPESDRMSALVRLARLKGRPVLAVGRGTDFLRGYPHLADITFLRPPVAEIFNIPDGKIIDPHTDLWMHRASKYRDHARQWLKNVMTQ